ncbi:hypothetical protein ABZW10_03595 [Kitasatospora sp. NPDC004723]|uniref:hypothetical protein n=1 Tax=unclassified Kitasatospora TaxID=2633591 RepID=UPI0033B2C026
MPAAPPQNPHSPFDRELCELVHDTAPKLFAVVQVHRPDGEEADGWVVAWGLATEEGPAHVVSIDGHTRMTLASPERALRLFTTRPDLTSRLVWLTQPGAAALDRLEAA